MPRRRPSRRRRTRRAPLALAALLLVLWGAQLGYLWSQLSGGGAGMVQRWQSYWRLRAVYRPALWLVEGSSAYAANQTGWAELHIDAGAFHPLSRPGAQRGFVVATLVYAAAGTAACGGACLAIRLNR